MQLLNASENLHTLCCVGLLFTQKNCELFSVIACVRGVRGQRFSVMGNLDSGDYSGLDPKDSMHGKIAIKCVANAYFIHVLMCS